MYQVYKWDSTKWIEVEGTLVTMEDIATEKAEELSKGNGKNEIYGVIEDGYDTPRTIFHNGRVFPRTPLAE